MTLPEMTVFCGSDGNTVYGIASHLPGSGVTRPTCGYHPAGNLSALLAIVRILGRIDPEDQSAEDVKAHGSVTGDADSP